jgi:hypothetical protein
VSSWGLFIDGRAGLRRECQGPSGVGARGCRRCWLDVPLRSCASGAMSTATLGKGREKTYRKMGKEGVAGGGTMRGSRHGVHLGRCSGTVGGPVHKKNGECKKPREKRLRAYAAKAAHRGWGGGGTSTGQSSRSRHRRDGAALWRWRT